MITVVHLCVQQLVDGDSGRISVTGWYSHDVVISGGRSAGSFSALTALKGFVEVFVLLQQHVLYLSITTEEGGDVCSDTFAVLHIG